LLVVPTTRGKALNGVQFHVPLPVRRVGSAALRFGAEWFSASVVPYLNATGEDALNSDARVAEGIA
jgi:hypothetical protein